MILVKAFQLIVDISCSFECLIKLRESNLTGFSRIWLAYLIIPNIEGGYILIVHYNECAQGNEYDGEDQELDSCPHVGGLRSVTWQGLLLEFGGLQLLNCFL
jgi:hypothetical protein